MVWSQTLYDYSKNCCVNVKTRSNIKLKDKLENIENLDASEILIEDLSGRISHIGISHLLKYNIQIYITRRKINDTFPLPLIIRIF